MRLVRALSLVATGLVAVVGSATAGGWATAELSSPPTAIEAGQEWNAQVTILRHGRTPTDGARPSVTIREKSTGQSKTFRATPSGEVGRYEVGVVFPETGTWTLTVDNGLAATGYGVSQSTRFGSVTVEERGALGDRNTIRLAPLAAGVLAAVALAIAGALGVRRLRKPAAAS